MSFLCTCILATPLKLSFFWLCWGWASVPLRWTSGHGIQVRSVQLWICDRCCSVATIGSHYGPSSWYHRLGCHPCCWRPLVILEIILPFLSNRSWLLIPPNASRPKDLRMSLSSANWWYPWFMSKLLKTLQSLKVVTKSSVIGACTCLVCCIALFKTCKSRLTWLVFGFFCFGWTTISEHQVIDSCSGAFFLISF